MDSSDVRRLNSEIKELGKTVSKAMRDLGLAIAKSQHPAYRGMETLDANVEPLESDVLKGGIPVSLDWWITPVEGLATAHKFSNGALVIEIVVTDPDGITQIEYELDNHPVEALQLSSIEPGDQ